MFENEYRFDTWIRTPSGKEFEYYYPSGLSAKDEETLEYLPALKIKPKQPGINYKYYEGKFKFTDEIKSKPIKEGITRNMNLDIAAVEDSFAIVFEGYIYIQEKGVYTFYSASDDGSKLLIDDNVIANNDGSHGLKRVDGKVALERGYHKIKVLYFEDYMGQKLDVGYSARNMRECPIPDHVLFAE